MTSTATRQGSRIIATGCTSGLGLTAIRHILQTSPASLSPPYHVILLGRGKNPTMALDELSAIDTSSLVDFIPCDLTSLTSVKNATEEIRSGMQCEKWRRIAPGRIDVLLLNAGIAKLQRTLVRAPSGEGPTNTPIEALRDQEERYEETALVNHVSQQYLVSLLLPYLLSPTAHSNPPRIIFTSSALHRKLPNISDLDLYFNPRYTNTNWSLIKSYTASKFLQVVGVQQLIHHLRGKFAGEKQVQIEIVLVEPGFIPNTGLSRENPTLIRFLMSYILPYLPFLSFVESPQQGGENIAQAMTRPLHSFQWAQGDIDERWDGMTVVDGVRTVHLVKRGRKSVPDLRSEDQHLGTKWWPRVVPM